MTANPGRWNAEAHIGSRFYRKIIYEVKVGENYEPVDLTGYSARYTARRGNAGELVVELTDSAGITLGGAAGTIEIEVAATTTDDWIPGEARHDLHLTPVSGAANTFKLLIGRLSIEDWVEPESEA